MQAGVGKQRMCDKHYRCNGINNFRGACKQFNFECFEILSRIQI